MEIKKNELMRKNSKEELKSKIKLLSCHDCKFFLTKDLRKKERQGNIILNGFCTKKKKNINFENIARVKKQKCFLQNKKEKLDPLISFKRRLV